jgi:hypothetical protein
MRIVCVNVCVNVCVCCGICRHLSSGYDWESSIGFVFDFEMRSKYISKRSYSRRTESALAKAD